MDERNYQGIKDLVGGRPVGIYMGCPKEGLDLTSDYLYDLAGMICTEENLKKCKDWGISFIILGGNPGSGTSIKDVVRWTKKAREICGEDMLIFAGKWEDCVVEKVLGDPLADYDAKEIIDQLIENGADINIKNIDGKTAWSLAEERNYSKIVDLLKKYLPKRRLEL